MKRLVLRKNILIPIFLASLTGVGMLWVFLSIPPVSSVSYREIGGFTLLIGIMHIACSKKAGQKVYRKMRAGAKHVARFWGALGEDGTQLFYRTIGI